MAMRCRPSSAWASQKIRPRHSCDPWPGARNQSPRVASAEKVTFGNCTTMAPMKSRLISTVRSANRVNVENVRLGGRPNEV